MVQIRKYSDTNTEINPDKIAIMILIVIIFANHFIIVIYIFELSIFKIIIIIEY